MDISGAQLNSAVLDAVSAQPQTAPQNNRPSPSSAQKPVSTEVTLSRDARDRAAQPAPQPTEAATAANVTSNPVQAPAEAQPTQGQDAESRAVQARESDARAQQANPAVQAQANAPTYTARVAAQSYSSVSNF